LLLVRWAARATGATTQSSKVKHKTDVLMASEYEPEIRWVLSTPKGTIEVVTVSKTVWVVLSELA
jgi:hypothetical protein